MSLRVSVRSRSTLFGACLAAGVLMAPQVWALSELKEDQTQTGQTTTTPPSSDTVIERAPLPSPDVTTTPAAPSGTDVAPGDAEPAQSPETTPGANDAAPAGDSEQVDPATPSNNSTEAPAATDAQTESDEQASPDAAPDRTAEPPAEILRDLSVLPEPTRRMRELILEATKSGDIEKLRPLLGTGDSATQLSLSGIDGDPIAFIKELAGDEGGQEILAILEEVLEAGFVHLDANTANDIYVWPYFFAVPLETLTPPQRVELFRIVTAGDYEEMKSYGTYIFYRVGITPKGEWSFFVAGD